MATTVTATRSPKTNRIGLTVLDYRGGKTTLCAGCGHNASPSALSTLFTRWAFSRSG